MSYFTLFLSWLNSTGVKQNPRPTAALLTKSLSWICSSSTKIQQSTCRHLYQLQTQSWVSSSAAHSLSRQEANTTWPSDAETTPTYHLPVDSAERQGWMTGRAFQCRPDGRWMKSFGRQGQLWRSWLGGCGLLWRTREAQRENKSARYLSVYFNTHWGP